MAFGLTLVLALGMGLALYFPLKPQFRPQRLRQREACFIVTFAWLAIAGLGSFTLYL